MRNTIAIRLVLGLAMLLALFFVAAGMSFWQADAVDEKTEHIVRDLEPKSTVAYEMELNSIETEMAVLEYLRNPDPALRTRIAESPAYFGRLEQEYLRLANPEEIVQVANRLGEYSAGFAKDSKTLLNQADVQQSLLKSLNLDFDNLDSLVSIDLSEQMELHTSYGAYKLMHLQTVDTEIAGINDSVAAYLQSPEPVYRDQIAGYSQEFHEAIARFNNLVLTEEEKQRAEGLDVLFAGTEVKVAQLLDLKDSLDENTAVFLAQRAELAGILNEQVQVPTRLQMIEAKDAVHFIDSQTTRVTLILLVAGLVFVFAGVLFIFRRISNPVSKLVSATNKVAEGDLSTRVEVVSRDEIGLLGAAFNDMIASREEAERALVSSEEEQRRLATERQEAQDRLLRAHDELENRVLERTLELEKTRDIAQEATEAKSRFLANMSHELRTPLNAVIGYSELLIDEAVDADNTVIVPDLERITAAGKLLLTLVSGILDLAKVEAGKMELFNQEFSIPSVVQEARAITETMINANKNTLVVDCPTDIGFMRGDQVKLSQMLFNLLSNAGKFTEEGNISLSAAREIRDGVDWVIFTVTDTGIGITPDASNKIFLPFTQADLSTVHKYGGTGLGLSVCRSFSQMMGGTITVESRPGAGATFVISLPTDFNLPVADAIGLETPADAGTVLLEVDGGAIQQVSRV